MKTQQTVLGCDNMKDKLITLKNKNKLTDQRSETMTKKFKIKKQTLEKK